MWNQKVNLQNNTAKLKYLNTSPENSSQMKINQLFKQIEKKKKRRSCIQCKEKEYLRRNNYQFPWIAWEDRFRQRRR